MRKCMISRKIVSKTLISLLSNNFQRSVPGVCRSFTFGMDYYLSKYEELLNAGDPEVRSWFLMRNNYLPIVLSGLYVLFSTKVGPALMSNRKPFDLRNSMIAFNFFLVIVYIVCLAISIWNLQYTYTNFSFFCEGNIIKKGHVAYTFAHITWVLYLMKYVEFLDTIFFILRKKQNLVSFLHVTHHAAVPLLFWLILRTETAAIQILPMNLNSFVHVVMYTYYGLAAMGPSVRKHLWWKKYITQLQIVQFLLIILLGTVVVPLTKCKVGIFTYVTNICFVPLFLYLFFKFYIDAYLSRTKTKENGVTLNKQENGFTCSGNKDK